MPYTPPSQRSPANSKPNSPVLSRSHSYAEEKSSLPHSHSYHNHRSHSERPSLPRSLSSTAYLQRHRRTPSISDQANSKSGSADGKSHNASGSHSQPPAAVGGSLTSPAAINTPPDSTNNSSDEDDRGRQQQLTGDLAQLAQALQKIEVKRDPSPVGENRGTIKAPSITAILDLATPALTKEALKIAHSRSASELTLSTHNTQPLTDSPIQTSDDSDDDDLHLSVKPPLLRKKSGELVKPALRPASRRRPSSMPGTPTFSKVVHFNENMEQVRHFLQVDRPIAVSAGSSPVSELYDSDTEYPFGSDATAKNDAEWDIKLSNFPGDIPEREILPVRMERIFLSSDHKNLIGTIAVANIAFQKVVIARFTLDYWKTTSEVVAEYTVDVRKKHSDGCDRFNFCIKLSDLANLESKTLLLCVRYQVNGTEYWDNNNNMNYQVDFTRKSKGGKPRQLAQGAGTLGAIPRSRHTSNANRPRSYPTSLDEDFANGFGSRYEFGGRGKKIDEPANAPLRLKKSSKKGVVVSDHASLRQNTSGSPFATRYDFGASLTAALSNAQTKLEERPPPRRRQAPKTTEDRVGPKEVISQPAPPAATSTGSTPTTITSEKPALQSAEYNELIQKYCFFGSGKSSPQMSSPEAAPPRPPATDGVRDSDSDASPPGSNPNSGSNTPSPTNGMSPAFDGSSDQSSAPKGPRSTSPGAFGSRTASPVSFGYPYHQNMGGIFPESHTPTAIRG